MKILYVNQLTEEEQEELLKPIEKKLREEGLTEQEIRDALEDARTSKISDVQGD